MDRLTHLLDQFSLHAGVFYSGTICGEQSFQAIPSRGHVHLVKRGPVKLIGAQEDVIDVINPTLLFLPRPEPHRLQTDESAGADIICGTVQFDGGRANPIIDSLPNILMIEVSVLPGADSVINMMFEESLSIRSGRQAVMDRLFEVLMILLLRYCVEQGLTHAGTLAGLSDIRLAKTLIAVHNNPAHEWNISSMASLAGMSRARFSYHFRLVTGDTPADYLASWRVMIAQRLLMSGFPLKQVAYDVGYGSASALTRAFFRKIGCTPNEWIKQ
ncbi:AraC family transcriptional regulator [Pseudomonas sp. DP16D-R1]|jgi:AraC-like DNA-binding protein|uniref:AraC family transcriptional regulator n=1 Tax=Pseudomonas sp. DP16D-R1 TaxID=2075551 RepID=UPI000CD17D05|nr:AraC family transcriptional regulator [Pseudomonas sp. DP16D-R1]POA77477.1 AraC family transcriptional regulator [Pseudomonas sp. DP16D-R1]